MLSVKDIIGKNIKPFFLTKDVLYRTPLEVAIIAHFQQKRFLEKNYVSEQNYASDEINTSVQIETRNNIDNFESYFIALDTETTGLPPKGKNLNPEKDWPLWNSCRMVEMAYEKRNVKTNEIIKKETFLVFPEDFVIPQSAINIHGITNEMAAKEGRPIETIFDILFRDITQSNNPTMVAHNMAFDENVLLAELYRLQARNPQSTKFSEYINNWKGLNKHCTMLVGTEPGGKWPKLNVLYLKYFPSLPEGSFHRAAYDANLCSDIYYKQITGF